MSLILGAAVLGLGACSNMQPANPDQSDFVKMLKNGGQTNYHWSDYLADSSGHEVFKNLEFEVSGLTIKARELDLQKFHYDISTDNVNADYMRLRDIDWVDDGEKILSIDEIDVPKLASDEQGTEINAKIKRITLHMEDDAEDQTPTVIDEAEYAQSDNYITDDSVMDMSALITGKARLHLKMNYTGAKDFKNFSTKYKGGVEEVDPSDLFGLLFQSVKLKSMDIDIEDQGYMADLVKEVGKSMSEYADQIETCNRVENALGGHIRVCRAITDFMYGNKKTIRIAARPDEPIPLGKILYMIDAQGIRGMLALAMQLNLKASNE